MPQIQSLDIFGWLRFIHVDVDLFKVTPTQYRNILWKVS